MLRDFKKASYKVSTESTRHSSVLVSYASHHEFRITSNLVIGLIDGSDALLRDQLSLHVIQ